MVLANYNLADNHCRFILSANQSMSWQQTLIFLYLVGAVNAIIAVGCLYFGLWLVLPFSGLEMLLLTVCLYLVSHRTNSREIITIDKDQIVIESGYRRIAKRQTFSRHWAKIAITTPTHQWYASRLLIGTHGKRVEIGRDLVEQERIALAKALTQILPLHRGLI